MGARGEDMHTLWAQKTWCCARLKQYARGWGLSLSPSLSRLSPLLHDKPQDINRSFEMSSGPCLGKLALEQQRLH